MDRNPAFWTYSHLTTCLGVNIILVANAPHFVAVSAMTVQMVVFATLMTINRSRRK